ncbi:Hypp5774 [Branchiostoma lanceolatum]|uniref:Hypp5774 protein n=1 Tax=Branchiostoma lanceolatum TaxID=7740 RepID=A0A8J9YM96_BRALA|nr:Hypp5774 [Branchiostoma lanceolatum]
MEIGEMPGAFPLPGPSTSNENGTIEISTVTGNIPVNNRVDAQISLSGYAMDIIELPGVFPLPGPSTSNENGTIEISTVTGNIPVNNPVDGQIIDKELKRMNLPIGCAGNAVNIGEMPGAFPLPGPSTSNENGTIEISTVTGNIPVTNPVDAPER